MTDNSLEGLRRIVFRVYLTATAIAYGLFSYYVWSLRPRLNTAATYRAFRSFGGATFVSATFVVVAALCVSALASQSRLMARIANSAAVGNALLLAAASVDAWVKAHFTTAALVGIIFWGYFVTLQMCVAGVPLSKYWRRR